MATASVSRSAVSSGSHADDDVAAQSVVVVYDCSRLGRTANPPSFSFSDWFRLGRKR
jgi:hypothetical protein